MFFGIIFDSYTANKSKQKPMKTTLLLLLFLGTTITCHSQWIQTGTALFGDAASDEFGEKVAMNASGDIIAVGARFNDIAGFEYGQVKVFQLLNNSWEQLGNDLLGETTGNFGEKFGWDLDLNATGTRIVVGAPFYVNGPSIPGATRVFEFTGTDWLQMGQTIEGQNNQDFGGWSVSINNDGTRIITGSVNNSNNGTGSGQARVYDYDGANWIQAGNNIEGETEYLAAGAEVAINGLGSRVAVGLAENNNPSQGQGNGIVRIFELQGATWEQLAEDIVGDAEGEDFGTSIALNTTGSRIALGARLHNGSNPFSGEVKVFELDGSNWTQLGTDLLGEDFEALGISVDLNAEGTLLVAGGRANNPIDLQKGIVRIFRFINGNWQQVDSPIYGDSNEDQAGQGVAINANGNSVVIGAPFADENGESSGQAKVFQNDNVLSVSETNVNFTNIKLYPNPNNGAFSISFSENQPSVLLELTDVSGRKIGTSKFLNTKEVSVAYTLQTGVYLATITAANLSEMVRILIE